MEENNNHKNIEVRDIKIKEGFYFLISHLISIAVYTFIGAAILKYYGMDCFIYLFHIILNYKTTNIFNLTLSIFVVLFIIYIISLLLTKIFSFFNRIVCLMKGDVYHYKDIESNKQWYAPLEYLNNIPDTYSVTFEGEEQCDEKENRY